MERLFLLKLRLRLPLRVHRASTQGMSNHADRSKLASAPGLDHTVALACLLNLAAAYAGRRDSVLYFMRTFAGTAAVLAGFAMLLTACGSQSAGDIQTQHGGAMRSAERFAREQAAAIVFPQPLVINEGRDLGCSIRPLSGLFGTHDWDCLYVYDAYALDAGSDSRPRVAQLVRTLQAAGWSFYRGTVPGQNAVIDLNQQYGEYQRDPARVVLFPLHMRLAGAPDGRELSLDVVTPARLDYGGYTRYQRSLINRFAKQVTAGRFLYGFQIEFTYAVGECRFCETDLDPGLRSLSK
jgi:hypothetical protein